MSAIDALVANARRFAGNSAGLPARPASGVAVVACMDARLDPHRLLGLADGDAHVIRNAGGVVTDDVIRSLVISQRQLGTTEVMLIHHSGCGMMTFTDDEEKARIEADTGLRPPFAIESFSDVDADVRQSIARVVASPYLPHRDEVRGFVYELESGSLREVTAAPAR
jgi:carbonic anhydrase